MKFTSIEFMGFLVIVLSIYWAIDNNRLQNIFLVFISYVFYGWVHPWFCALLMAQTTVDYFTALRMMENPSRKKTYLAISLTFNLGLLGIFKYFNFFAENVNAVLSLLGLSMDALTLHVLLPAGISFYTFETMSYSIDVYRGVLRPRKNFVDYSLFVAFFPHLVAGPIQRANQFLPQLEKKRRMTWAVFDEAWPLIIRGYVEKRVIADNISVYADKVFMLRNPTLLLLAVGAMVFALQIYTDFLGYTDIARGVALLFGLRLSDNFRSPYLAISPSDFWRRWHITFSTWIRDYLYIPLGGSRTSGFWTSAIILLITMSLSGLWHGAEWHFVAWGFYNGLLLFLYHRLGLGGHWKPTGRVHTLMAWFLTFDFILFGWLLFRTPSLSWLYHGFAHFSPGWNGDSLIASATILLFAGYYAMPLFVWLALDRGIPQHKRIHALVYGIALTWIFLLAPDKSQDFIYFQF